MRVEDGCKIEVEKSPTQEDFAVLSLLYAPLVKEKAAMLYQLFVALAKSPRPITNHRLICQLGEMSIERFEKERQTLERYLLLKSYLDPQTNTYLYRVLAVKSANAFLRHEVFGRLYLRSMGKEAYEYAKLTFAKEQTDTKPYVEVSASFQGEEALFSQDGEAFISLRPKESAADAMIEGFDFGRFLQGFQRRFPAQLQTREHLELIGELAIVHGIDEMEMRKLVNQCVNPRTKQFNTELLKRKARSKGRNMESEWKDPYQAPPVQFFKSLQPHIPISAADSRLIESLLTQYHLPKEVVNVLIEYVLKRTDQSFARSYVEKVAASWARLGIDTLEKAKQQVNKEQHAARAPSASQKALPQWYAQVEDESVEAIDDQTIEQLQQRLGRQQR